MSHPDEQSTTIAELNGVSVDLGPARVLSDLDLEITPGDVLGLTGPNGSGKTTLLSVLATLKEPVEGTCRVLGVDTRSPDVREIRPRIGLSGHEPVLYEQLTLRENLEHFGRLSEHSAGEIGRSLEMVGLARVADRRAGACSQGMRRRADLARLIARRPSFLLLDEAHAGLDAEAWEIVTWLCRRTAAAGGACVVVAHEPDRLTAIASRVTVLREGALIES